MGRQGRHPCTSERFPPCEHMPHDTCAATGSQQTLGGMDDMLWRMRQVLIRRQASQRG